MKMNSINGFCLKIFSFFLVLNVLFVCGSRQCRAKDKLNIVTTTTNLESIAKAVGGEYVDVFSIAGGSEDPHFIEAKPSYMIKAKNADLWIRVGLELEIGYEELIIAGSRNQRIRNGSPGHLDVSEGIIPLEVPTRKIDRSLGDVHPLGNPHYWLDPYNGRIIAQNICRRLKQLDPEHAGDFDRNLAGFLSKLDNAMFGSSLTEIIKGENLWKMQSDGSLERFIKNYNEKVLQAKQANPQTKEETISLGGWLAKLKPYEHSKIVTYHRSWSYFTHRFDLDVVAELEPKPGIPPGPGHVLKVINTMKAEKVGIILMEPFYNRSDADEVAKRTGAKVVVASVAVNNRKEGDNYIAMLDNIVTQLSSTMSEVPK
jgi:ABC-type Zn uptake system ZnuABC Zn-binding protein ZnuA